MTRRGRDAAQRTAAALAAWTEALGPERVVTDATAVRGAATATFQTTQRVLGIVRPVDTASVQRCVRIAGSFGIPLYPVSRGRNWGFGSRVPPVDGCVLLELSEMDRILDYDADLACLTIEPGVTFRQVHDFLRAQQSAFFLAAIGGPADASVLANVLERGDGMGPTGDRLAHACDFEVVLPDGSLLRTGFGRFSRARTAALHRYGVGPSLEGLFTQSGLGVVTRLTIWLSPLPARCLAVTFSTPGTSTLAPALDTLRFLVLRDVLRPHTVTLWNAYRLRARNFALKTGAPTLGDAAPVLDPWFGTAAIYAATAAHAAADRAAVEAALTPVVEALRFVEVDPTAPGDAAACLGAPDDTNLRSLYWRKPSGAPPDPDPDRDHCGLIWACPALPFRGTEAALAVQRLESMMLEDGFEPSIGMLAASGRALHVFASILYDRDHEREDDRAMRCHDRILSWCAANGYPPYRLGIQSMDQLPHDDGAARLVRVLRDRYDPGRVLAPGRYERLPVDGPDRA